MAPAAYPRVALCDGLRRCEGSASIATAAVRRQIARTLTRRAGPALPSYLALHHAGFSVPHTLLRERWALTPPFHPYQRIVRRRFAGFPARRHRAVSRRSIFCGTFREQVALSRAEACVRAACSPGVTRRVALAPDDSGRCPDFPPALPPCDGLASDHPAHPLWILYREAGDACRSRFGNGAWHPPPLFFLRM
jgi:hypothetical protein